MVSIVYMVAGLSSRFNGKLKALAKISKDESLIEYSLNQALPAGFDKIVFIVSNKTKPFFQEKFGESYKNIPIQYALQNYDSAKRDKPWGTLDALCSANHLLNEPFVICNGDDLYGKNTFKTLFNHLKSNQNNEAVTVGYYLKEVLPNEGWVNRGIFEIDNSYILKINEVLGISKYNLEEKKLDLNNLCSMNIFGLFPSSLEKLNQILEEFKQKNQEEKTNECFLPVELSSLINSNELKMKIYPTEDNWYGITNPGDEIIIQKKLEENS